MGLLLASWYHPATHSRDNAAFDVAVVIAFGIVLLIYFWLLARSLKGFTRLWDRGLFIRLVAWIAGLIGVAIMFVRQIDFYWSAPFFPAYFGLFLLWLVSTLAFYRAGGVVGLWLTRSS